MTRRILQQRMRDLMSGYRGGANDLSRGLQKIMFGREELVNDAARRMANTNLGTTAGNFARRVGADLGNTARGVLGRTAADASYAARGFARRTAADLGRTAGDLARRAARNLFKRWM